MLNARAHYLLKTDPKILLKHAQPRIKPHPGKWYVLLGIVVGTILSFFIMWPANFAFADPPIPLRYTASNAINAMMSSCQDTGVFAVDEALFACKYAGELSGDLLPDNDTPLVEQQERLSKFFRTGNFGVWMEY